MTINEFMLLNDDINPYISIYTHRTIKPRIWEGRYEALPKKYGGLNFYSFDTHISDFLYESVIEFNVEIED